MNRQEEIEKLEAVIREARGMVKDLRRETKIAKEAEESLRAAVIEQTEEQIEEALREGLEVLSSGLKKAMDDGTAKCIKEFDKLANLFLTGNQQGRGPSIEEYFNDQ